MRLIPGDSNNRERLPEACNYIKKGHCLFYISGCLTNPDHLKKDIGHVLRSLVYFEDAEQEPEPKMIVKISWKQLKKNLNIWLNNIRDQKMMKFEKSSPRQRSGAALP